MKFLICFLAIMICLGGCLTHTPSQEITTALAQTRTDGASEEPIRVLVLGCDRAAGLTDSILVASIREKSGEVQILQLPRDTYAEYTERDYKKLNGAYGTLGLSGVKRFLSDALGVRLDYAIALDLDCVSELVDAVGGVDVEVTQTMHYHDPYQNLTIDLEPGMHRLDGARAEHFLRFRSGYVNADLGRMDAQKRFIRAFVARCGELNGASLMQIFWKLFPHIETDLPVHKAIGLVRAIDQCDANAIEMATAPGQAVQGSSGAWYYSLNRAGMIRAIRQYLLLDSYSDADFDPNGVFDRSDLSDFHNIYIAPDGGE